MCTGQVVDLLHLKGYGLSLLAVGSPGGLGFPPCLMQPLGFALCTVLKAPAFWGETLSPAQAVSSVG